MQNQDLEQIISPQLTFEGAENLEKFVRFYCDLYRIQIYKDGLDLILTKLKEKDLTFEVKIIKGWDTNVGCYLTEQSKIYNQFLGKFSRQVKKKIILRSFAHNVMAHEMAHALEFESGLNLGEEFRKCIGFDMKDRQADSLPLRAQIKRLMVEALKAYPSHQFISELFARYFELLSIARDVQGQGDFDTAQVMDFFSNTTNFVTKIFNARIQKMIDPEIAAITSKIAAQVQIEKPQKRFQDSVDSFYKKVDGPNGERKWAKNVKSNAQYQVGWQQYQALEDKKDKK